MEAQSLPRRGRVARTSGTARAGGLGFWLLALLLAAFAFAAFSGGAIEIPAESRLQVGIAAIGLLCGLGLIAGGLRAGRVPPAWWGVGLLAAFAAWSAISFGWSADPEATWIAANRALAYAAVAAVALVAASSTRNAPVLVAGGLAGVSLIVCLYALAHKVVPGIHVGPLNLDPGDSFARLSDPIDYWNALGLLCVMASPAFIWLATLRSAPPAARVGALLALALVLLTGALTYSRGAIIAYAVMLAVMVAAGPRRLARLAVGCGVLAAMVPAMLVAFTRADLSKASVALSSREEGGLVLGLAIVASLLALALIGRWLISVEARGRWNARRSRRAWRLLAIAAAVALLGGLVAVAVSERGLTGTISHEVDVFKRPKGVQGNTPERLISSNGSSRYIWWEEALGAFSDRPLDGWGAGSFPVLHFLYRRYPAPVRSAHSVPLQFLSETGLAGALLGLGGLVVLGFAALRRIRGSDGIERSARLVLAASAAAWAVHAFYDWDWEIPAVTIPALIAICVAAAPSPSAARRSAASRGSLWRVAAFGAAALAALAVAVSAALPALSQGRRIQALATASRAGGLAQAAGQAADAHDLDPLALEPLLTGASIAADRGRAGDEAALLSEATRVQPQNWRTWQRLAEFDSRTGDRAGAIAAIERWGQTDPLLFKRRRARFATRLFEQQAPPAESPTAYGSPPG